jgi:very-short-patch-repair endonuclease
MKFQMAHTEFIMHHANRRSGERLRRLNEGHSHAEKKFLEKVWWPAIGHFEHLHPEYEIRDFRDGIRFLDFAFIVPPVRLAIEIDGYGPHLLNVSRSQYSDERMRQNHLVNDGWKIHRYTYDDLTDRPRMCQQMIHQFIGRYLGAHRNNTITMTRDEQDILRLALRQKGIVNPETYASC